MIGRRPCRLLKAKLVTVQTRVPLQQPQQCRRRWAQRASQVLVGSGLGKVEHSLELQIGTRTVAGLRIDLQRSCRNRGPARRLHLPSGIRSVL